MASVLLKLGTDEGTFLPFIFVPNLILSRFPPTMDHLRGGLHDPSKRRIGLGRLRQLFEKSLPPLEFTETVVGPIDPAERPALGKLLGDRGEHEIPTMDLPILLLFDLVVVEPEAALGILVLRVPLLDGAVASGTTHATETRRVPVEHLPVPPLKLLMFLIEDVDGIVIREEILEDINVCHRAIAGLFFSRSTGTRIQDMGRETAQLLGVALLPLLELLRVGEIDAVCLRHTLVFFGGLGETILLPSRLTAVGALGIARVASIPKVIACAFRSPKLGVFHRHFRCRRPDESQSQR